MAIDWTAVSPLAVPGIQDLVNRALGVMPQNMLSVQDMVSKGMSSPLLSEILNPMMQRYFNTTAADMARNTTDAFRAAGGLRSGAYGTSMARTQGDIGYGANTLMSQILSSTLSPLLNAQLQEQRNQFLPFQSYADLIGALRPTVLSGGGGGGSNSFDPTTWIDQQTRDDLSTQNRPSGTSGGAYGFGPSSGGSLVSGASNPLPINTIGSGTDTYSGGGGGYYPPEQQQSGFGTGPYDSYWNYNGLTGDVPTYTTYPSSMYGPETTYGAWEPDYSNYPYGSYGFEDF